MDRIHFTDKSTHHENSSDDENKSDIFLIGLKACTHFNAIFITRSGFIFNTCMKHVPGDHERD